MGLLIPQLDSATNKFGFTLTASSTDSTGSINGPFQNSDSLAWVASTGGAETFTIQSYPITVNAFYIQGNMQNWKIQGSVDGTNYMDLYYGSALDINTPLYVILNAGATWEFLNIVNIDTLPNNEKVTIKMFQCFD